MGILRATKYKTFLRLSAAIFLLSTFFVANLMPLSASAAVVAPTLPISWVDNAHKTAVDAGGNQYNSIGYACVVGAISVTNSAGTAIDTSNAGTNGTVKVNVVTETGNGTAIKAPGCANSTVAEYVWVSTNTSTHYALIVYSPSLSSTVKTQLDPKQCPVNTNTGCNAVVWVLSAAGALDTGSGIGNPAGTGNFLKVTTMTVNPAVISQAITPTTPASATAADLSCPNNGFSWIICPIISMAKDAADVFDGQITCLMQIDLTDVFGNGSNANNPYAAACGSASDTATIAKTSNAYYHAWNTFRSLALALIVIAGLVMIISQAAGAELLDAYAIRKILPRLLIAGVAITLSWQIMEFLIQITNAVGYGVRDIIYYPFNNFGGLTISGIGSTLVGLLVGGGAIIALGAPGLLLLALTAVLGAIVAFITLILRKLVIIFLLMLAPLAIACYILPNTQKVWKMWWDTLSKALMMFPIIAAMIAVGHVFAATSYGSGGGGVISQSIALLAYFLPYFMIPTAVRMAGGAVGSIGGMISKASHGGFAGLSKMRKQQVAKNMALTKSGQRFAGGTKTNTRGKFNTALQYASNINHAGANPTKWKDRMGATLARTSGQQRAMMMKDEDYDWAKDDALNKAAFESNSESQLKTKLLGIDGRYTGESDPNLHRDIEKVKHMRAKYNPEAFKQATYLNAVAGGTAFKGIADVWQGAVDVAGGDNSLLSTLIGINRSVLMGVGRVDQGGGGFSDTFEVAAKLRDGSYTLEQADRAISKSVIENQGAGVIAHASMKPRAVKNLMPEYRLELAEAIAAKNKAVADNRPDLVPGLDDAIAKQLAVIANLYDHASNSSPLSAGHIKDQLLDWDPTSPPAGSREEFEAAKTSDQRPKNSYNTGYTTKTLMEEFRNDPAFLAYRRELNAQEQRLQGEAGGGGSIGGATDGPASPLKL